MRLAQGAQKCDQCARLTLGARDLRQVEGLHAVGGRLNPCLLFGAGDLRQVEGLHAGGAEEVGGPADGQVRLRQRRLLPAPPPVWGQETR